MHLFIGMRGIKQHMDRVVSDLQAQYFPLPMTDASGAAIQNNFVQLAVRPVQLFELVFPKEQLQEVMKMLQLREGFHMASQKKLDKYMPFMRKLLGAKKLPKVEEGPRRLIYPLDYTHIVGIGYKEDAEITKDGLTYEAL